MQKATGEARDAEGRRRPPPDADALRLATLVGPERRRMALASVLSALASALWIGQALVLAMAVGAVLADATAGAGLAGLASAFLGLTLLKVGLEMAAGRIATAASEAVQREVRARLIARVAATSPIDARRPHSGEIAAVVTHHVEALGPYLLRYQPARVRMMLVPAAILLAVLPVSWLAALILLAMAPVIPIFMALIGADARSASRRHLARIGTMNGYLLDRLQGLTTIRLFDAVERTAAGLRTAGQRIHRATMAVLRIAFLSSAVLELFAALGVASVAVYVGFNLLGQITLGGYGAGLTLMGGLYVLLLAPEFFQPLREFAAAYHDRAAALAAAGEIGRLLEADLAPLPGHGEAIAGRRSLRAAPACIALEDVTLRLGEDRAPALRGVSLEVRAGERVALVGPSGCGKSMLLGAMAGLIMPSSGVVRVAGLRLDAAGADLWRSRIAWLPQRPGLVRASLKANLRLGRGGIAGERIAAAVRTLELRDVVDRLPRGLGTVIGESGEGLSGGEAQRCALARAVLADADVILADEPTEHLDDATAEAIRAALLGLAVGRTLVIVTHDERLMAAVDRVIDVAALQDASRLDRARAGGRDRLPMEAAE